MSHIQSTITLNNGISMPQFGLGVYKVENGLQTEDTVRNALQLGYHLIDTAAFYDNEEDVGKAIKASGLPREEIFITTKVWNSDQGYDSTLAAFEQSLKKLDTDYIDLYLIHWPLPGKYVDTWKALEKIYKEGKVRAIGVSNFHSHHLDTLLETAEIVPAVNQVERHPRLSQEELREYCKGKNIKLEAWAPIARGNLSDEPTLRFIASKHDKTPAQVILRWHLQNEVIIIPKTINEARLQENADIFDFELSLDEMGQIDALNMNERYGSNPDNL
ncbi:aldo/keto reductase [Cytobacillus purgationiresistens]|uniref:Diketogulonate reductase-like aldo/keto reductase n=1 Tax=Cytobacillus purgationiresistens TaxID=863449 RepID=A0ABU0AQS2_9BACI|nr:aldo/keto reductase [Cytobacillus purgationiresistens]MDQ0273631.1 diketogulonate reductase-like aldo/keto reductase [Cytobacillus purgationiresistens]